ncbi:DUF4350 domain-containing protein [Hymenobacter sp. NBH84]|uniref:DUF4350 domain-containing protein n=1 Tax=Hymenobacter sp. NBH84 TaxID=2596915 RepID=UPI0016249334|nr:DUF4350 domain-containing protein [Hymenobacter sp. NBH84]QNE40332.1 DUF4350 domain-containing protein [Hymenobacter sp. NBH84]
MTTFRWYLLGLVALFVGYVALEYYRPKPIDWTPTFRNQDKIPYGTYVLYQTLPEVLGARVQPVRLPIYNQLADDYADPAEANELETDELEAEELEMEEPKADTAALPAPIVAAPLTALPLAERSQYVFIHSEFNVSRPDLHTLLRYVARGNTVFIAANEFSRVLRDTLHFSTRTFLAQDTLGNALPSDSVTLRLLAPTLRRAAGPQFRYPLLNASTRLLNDSLGQLQPLAVDARNRPVLARCAYGHGYFYLSSVPMAFTNYFVLRPQTSDFAYAALSYLPAGRTTLWDEYQKQGREGQQSLLRVLLAHDSLRVAYYLFCVGVLLFMVFEARRRQRIIPVLRPLPNTTLLFTRTVASLYRQGSNHALIAEKKIDLFLDYVRTRFQEPTSDLNDEAFRERVAQKAGVPRPQVDALLRRINFIRTAPAVSDQELLRLSKELQQFKRSSR